MRWERADRKPLQPGEAWIRQTAIGVNFADIYYRRGVYPAPLPLILGREAAGVVEEVAADVTAVRPGDRVAYAGVNGSYAEGRAIAADRLVHVPDGIDDVTAAAATLRGMTAQVLIRGVCTVMSGDHVLVHAAAGGVGLLLCQWLSVLGAIVIGTVSSDEKAHAARMAGCHHPIVVPREDFAQHARRLTDGAGVAVVYDSVGRDTIEGSLASLRRRGMLVVFGQSSGVVTGFDINRLARGGSLSLVRPMLGDFISTRDELDTVAADVYEALASGILSVTVGGRYALEDAARAHRALETRQTIGSTVLIPEPD